MKEIFIERSESLLRIAIKENNELVESIVEEKKNGPIIGEIYKGKIKNIIPGTNSIFVDLGLDKEGYMYYSDELKSKNLKKGDEILVEVIKEPIGNKGAKITHKVSIPGKYVVLDCYSSGIKFSKRINDDLKKEEILTPAKTESKPVQQQPSVSAYPDSASYKITGTKTKYTIKEGETLTRVSLRFYGTKAMWPYIVKHNPDVIKNPNNVPYGTTIKIPELTKE